MQKSSILPVSTIALMMSFGVTAGALYVTVDAAARHTSVEQTADRVAAQEDQALRTQFDGAADETSSDVELEEGGLLNARFSVIARPSGKLVPSAGLQVTLVSAEGQQSKAKTDVDGVCSFRDLLPGLYTVTASGVDGRLSYGFRAVPAGLPFAGADGRPGQHQPVRYGLDTILDSALTSARDGDALRQVIDSVRVAKVAQLSGTDTEARAIPTAVQSEDNQLSPSYVGHQPLSLNDDGSLDGQIALLDPLTRLSTPVSDLTVSFIADNSVVAATTVNIDGSFVQSNLLPGIYSMVVAGRDGIAYLGLDVVSGRADARPATGLIPVAVRRRAPFSLGLVRGAGADNGGGGGSQGGGEEDDADPEPAADTDDAGEGQSQNPGPAGGAPGGGGSIGGGGSGGSGGGGLGLLAAGGIAAGIAAATSDDDAVASPNR